MRIRRCSSLGAMPEEAIVPGPAAELMFAPLELDFGGRRDALGRVRRQPRGPAAGRQTQDRRRSDRPRGGRRRARALGRGGGAPLARPRAGGRARRRRPPAAAALGAAALGRRRRARTSWRNGSSACASAIGRVQLHRPGGEQHRLFLASLPASRLPAARVQGAPAARPARGDGAPRGLPCRLEDRSLYRPHADAARARRSSSTSPRPASRIARRPACSPAPRHGQDDLSSSSPSGRPSCRDPVRSSTSTPRAITASTGCPASRTGSRRSSSRARSATAACSTRCGSAPRRPARTSPTTSCVSILPAPVKPEWQTQLRLAVSEAAPAGASSCAEIIERLAASASPEAIEAARAVEVHGSSRPRHARARHRQHRAARGRRRPGGLHCGSAT